MLIAYRYDPSVIQVLDPDPEFIRHCNREWPDFDFFAYYHRFEKTFNVALWTSRDGQFMADLVSLGEALAFTPSHKARIREQVDVPPDQLETPQRLRAYYRRKKRAEDEAHDALVEEAMDKKEFIYDHISRKRQTGAAFLDVEARKRRKAANFRNLARYRTA